MRNCRERGQGARDAGRKALVSRPSAISAAAAGGSPTVSAVIQEGTYELPRDEGPAVGNNRVKVEAVLDLGFPIDDERAFAQRQGAPLPRNPIPPRFNTESTLSVQIAAGENAYDIHIPAPRR